MSWLDTLKGRAQEAKAKPAEARPAPKPRQPRPEIRCVWIQTRAPDYERGEEGNVEPGYYTVSDGVLTMRDAAGKSTGAKHVLGPDDNERVIASRLTREAWQKAGGGGSDFNRRLDYGPIGIA
ncbi:hypothetical protein [Bradyrhizobium sp. RDM4]|uniref:hypothetical protein n=1 Tax=Bradyrhizobium sp. RDM4 TaxID=3378765 RepID=UPI0038FD03E6